METVLLVLTISLLSTCAMLSSDQSDKKKTAFSAHRFIYSITSSDCSEGSIAGPVVSPRSTMMHRRSRSKEARRVEKQTVDNAKQHHNPHCRLPAKLMYLANSTMHFTSLTPSTAIIIVE